MSTTAHWTSPRALIRATMIALALATAPGSLMAQETSDDRLAAIVSPELPPAFDSQAAAIDAFKGVLERDDFPGLATLLGLDPAKLAAEDGIMDTYQKIRDGAAKQVHVDQVGPDRAILEIGAKLWPLPFPVVLGDDGKWYFDTFAGLEEVVNRRIGENELQAIATMRAFVEAQSDYAEKDHDGDGVLEFARKLISSDGARDGLYWPTEAGEEASPAGNLDQGELDDAEAGEGYFGYKFRIIESQGDEIAGDAYDYVINDNMIAGFALLAWPAQYAETGVHTFAVNQHGIVYEIDLGPATADIVKYIDRFNPDATWSIVAD